MTLPAVSDLSGREIPMPKAERIKAVATSPSSKDPSKDTIKEISKESPKEAIKETIKDTRVFRHPAYLRAASPTHACKTKVVCTLGPATSSKQTHAELIENGMAIARLNMTHCKRDFAAEIIQNVRSYVSETNTTAEIGIWLDINGPKVRSGRLRGGKPVYLKAGETFFFVNDSDLLGDETQVATTYTKKLVAVGDKIWIDDGLISFTVVERQEDRVKCLVDNSGYLGEQKGINFPAHVIDELPAVSEKDRNDIMFAIEQDVDFISISCIRSVEDVQEVRMLMGSSKIKLLSKIENQRGMDNFESILTMSDGIVIDRGYLGAEVDVEIVTTEQKRLISMANAVGKPIFVANQMLESMRSHPRPTRSEAADVANAVMDGVDGLVLSAETAVGDYWKESLSTMRRIAGHAEKSFNYLDYQAKLMRNIPKPIAVSESIASSAVSCSRQVKDAAAIICITELGGTARLVAKYRPQIPVIATTLFKQTARQLASCFGIIPYCHRGSAETILHETMKYIVDLGIAKELDIVVVTSGQQVGFLEGTTTRLQVITIPKMK